MSSVNLMGYLDKSLQTILLLSAETFLSDSSDLEASSEALFPLKLNTRTILGHKKVLITHTDGLWKSTGEL